MSAGRRLRTLLLALAALPALGAGGAFEEREVKAAFLFNFPRFVEWPQEALGAADAPFTICVVGDDPIEELLARLVEGERVLGHPFLVRRVDAAKPVTGCHEVFVPESASRRADVVFAAVRGRPVLTVGESDAFLDNGGMILLRRDGNRVVLDVSVTAAQKANLVFSSKLLRIARVAEGAP